MLLLASLFSGVAAGADRFALFKSTDRARSWVRADAGLPAGSRLNALATSAGIIIAGTDSGIFISRDEARTWQPAQGTAGASHRVISLAVLGGKAFAGTDGQGVLVSLDNGKSWVVNTNFPTIKVRSLVASAGKLYAGSDAHGVFATEDGGQSWSQLLPGFPSHAQVFALSVVEGRLFAGLYSKGLYIWNEQERHWSRRGAVTPLVLAASGKTLVAGHNPGSLRWSGDLGITWSRGRAGTEDAITPLLSTESGELSDNAPVWELAANDELVLAGASDGIYYSEDRGRTWIRARTGLPEKSPGVSFLVERNFVLAGTREKQR